MDHMNSKITSDTSIDVIAKKINEGRVLITTRCLYTPPKLICLTDSNIETGTTTYLAEATNGAWKTGS